MIVPVNLLSRMQPIVKSLKPRKSEIIINREYSYIDTITINIPDSYLIGTLPQGKNIESKFGNFNFKISSSGNKITYTHQLIMFKGRHAASEYKVFYETILAISKADAIKLMLTKK